MPISDPTRALHDALYAQILKPEHAAVDIGEAAASLLALAVFVAECSPDRAAVLARLDETWLRLIDAASRRK